MPASQILKSYPRRLEIPALPDVPKGLRCHGDSSVGTPIQHRNTKSLAGGLSSSPQASGYFGSVFLAISCYSVQLATRLDIALIVYIYY